MKPGLSQLRTTADLLEKLRWEFKNLEAHPADAYYAFNFFVTAEHMADWTNNIPLRKTIPLLRITSHIASGGKHFELDPKRHKSVESVEHDGVYEPGVYEESVYDEWLTITLEPNEAKEMKCGGTTDAVSLAKQVLAYWEANA